MVGAEVSLACGGARVTGVRRNACSWPSLIPVAQIWPASLIPVACSSVMPESGGQQAAQERDRAGMVLDEGDGCAFSHVIPHDITQRVGPARLRG